MAKARRNSDLQEQAGQFVRSRVTERIEQIGEEHGVDVKKIGAKTVAKRGATVGAIKAVFGKGAAKTAEKVAGKTAARVTKGAAMSAARGVTKATAVKATGKVGGKIVSRFVPGLNIAMMAVDAVPTAAKGFREVGETAIEGAKAAGSELRAGRFASAAKESLRTGGRVAFGAQIAGLKTGVAAFTAKEAADLIPSGKQILERRKKQQVKMNPAPQGTPYLLALMLALRTSYQYAHWNAKPYADHLLFERLYKSLDEDIDALAELHLYGQSSLPQLSVSVSQIPKAEETIIRIATQIMETERINKGMENFLLNLVEHRERAIYLLRMASR